MPTSATSDSVPKPMHIGFLMVVEYTMITLANAIAVLRAANRESGQELFRWSVITLDGNPVFSSDFLELKPDGGLELVATLDCLMVCGGERIERHCDEPLLDALRSVAKRQIPLGGLCTGSFVLATAGLLEGYRCTVHWENMVGMQEKFPDLQVTSRLFVIDRDRYSCSGGVSSMDLMLNIISAMHGNKLVQKVSELLMYERVRTERDAQRVPLQHLIGASQPKLIDAVALMEANIEEPLSLDEVAEYVSISRRQLERLFHKYLHCAPSRYYLELRLHRARLLLLQTGMPVIDVAISCGFSTAPHFSKCYSELYGKPPRDERRAAS
ncbi:MAG: GlxA family transcriptional regulator [Pseudomonadales bacterium]